MSTPRRRIVGGLIITALTLIGVQIFGVVSASAHANFLSARSVCTTSGTYSVTWTVANDFNVAETATVTAHAPGSSLVSPTSAPIAASPGKPYRTTRVVQSAIAGTATSASITVRGIWADGNQHINSGAVRLGGSCTPPGGTTTTVTPVNPTVTEPSCDNGPPTQPALTLPHTSGITYTVTPGAPYRPAQTVIVRATADAGFSFATTPPGWTHVDSTHEDYPVTFDDTPTCTTNVTPASPTVTQSSCASSTTPVTPGLTTPSTPGITYTTSHEAPFAPGETVVVTATAAGTHRFASAPSGWTLVDSTHETFTVTFDSGPHCAVATAPMFADEACASPSSATYTIPAATGVTYSVNGTETAAGTYPATAGEAVTITATAQGGYTLTGSSSWAHTYATTGGCVASVIATAPHFADSVCKVSGATQGTYTIPATTGVVYTANGVTRSAGTYRASAKSTVILLATARSGYHLTGTTTWKHAYPASPDCLGTAGVTKHRGGSHHSRSHSTGSHSTGAHRGGQVGAASAHHGGAGALSNTGVDVAQLLLIGLGALVVGAGCLLLGVHGFARRRIANRS
jgi:hypothetical protein